MSKKSNKKLLSKFILGASILLASVSTGCIAGDTGGFVGVTLSKSDVSISDKVGIRVQVNNPYNHNLEYRFTADRGQVVSNDVTNPTAVYYSPFTGGTDTIRVTVFNRNETRNLPEVSHSIRIGGESVAFVELPNAVDPLSDTENGKIKVSDVRGFGTQADIGWGRDPQISPDGKYVAYVSYPGDGSSQIVLRDAVGNEVNVTNHRSFNIDPSWSPISSDGQIYLVFSSDRISTNSGNGVVGDSSGHGERYHLWRVNSLGGDLRQITNTAGNDFQPSWSPDGKQIAFSSDFDNNKSNAFRNLWTLDVGTGKQIQLTHESLASKGAYEPSWSPDGQRLTYTRKYKNRTLNALSDFQKIWMIDFNRNSEGFGQIVTRNFDETIVESSPSWTPDGRDISFIRARGTEKSLVSLPLSGIGSTSGSIIDPSELGNVRNTIEAQLARQRPTNYFGSPVDDNPWQGGQQGYDQYNNQQQQQYR